MGDTKDDSDQERLHSLLEGLMDRRTIALSGEINHESVSEIGRRMLMLQMRSSERINLLIDSGGGGIDSALRLCDLMTTILTTPIRGIALGACGSAATFIMLYCTERTSTPYSRFLIHSGTRNQISIPIGHRTSQDLEQLLKEVKVREEEVLRLYMERLTPPDWKNAQPSPEQRREFVQKLIARGDQPFDEWFSAEEAIQVGLIESIIRKKVEIFAE